MKEVEKYLKEWIDTVGSEVSKEARE